VSATSSIFASAGAVTARVYPDQIGQGGLYSISGTTISGAAGIG
jgi:hypothetical protein